MEGGGPGQAGQGAGDHYLPPLPPRPARHKQEEKNFCQNLVGPKYLYLCLSYISINHHFKDLVVTYQLFLSSKIFSVIMAIRAFETSTYLYPLYLYLYLGEPMDKDPGPAAAPREGAAGGAGLRARPRHRIPRGLRHRQVAVQRAADRWCWCRPRPRPRGGAGHPRQRRRPVLRRLHPRARGLRALLRMRGGRGAAAALPRPPPLRRGAGRLRVDSPELLRRGRGSRARPRPRPGQRPPPHPGYGAGGGGQAGAGAASHPQEAPRHPALRTGTVGIGDCLLVRGRPKIKSFVSEGGEFVFVKLNVCINEVVIVQTNCFMQQFSFVNFQCFHLSYSFHLSFHNILPYTTLLISEFHTFINF